MNRDSLQQKDEIISEFKNLITGGDSFIFLRPSSISDKNEILFILEFKGRYPLYDTSILIEEFDLKQIEGDMFQFQKTSQRSIPLGTVNPLQNNFLFSVKVPKPSNPEDQYGKRFFFKVNSRNGMIEEDLFLRQEGVHFSMAYKVVFFEPDYSGQFGGIGIGSIKRKVRHIDPMFPVHQLDHLEGDSGWKADYEISTGANIISN